MVSRPRFVVDINVGRLAKWLRVMGYDALFPRQADDNELVRIALRENRVLVTRDAQFALRRAARLGQLHVVYIIRDDLLGQLAQLVRELDLDSKSGFSRCVVCNAALETVEKSKVADRLPPYVLQNQQNFMECPQCLRVYWRGTHWAEMVSQLERVYRDQQEAV